MFFYKIWDEDMCENKIIYSNDKWDEKELEELVEEIQSNDEDLIWTEVIDILVNEYDFDKVECEGEIVCE